MTHPAREHGRSARMVASRRYLGLEQQDMAEQFGVRLGTYQSWESGRDPIPVTIWAELDNIMAKLDEEAAEVVAAAAEQPNAERVRVRIWRGARTHKPGHLWRQRVVAEAMRRDPRIEPVFPEDDQDD
ncbi:DUF1870 family protein [Nocardia panacis]|uniref:DUF1870 family protein n=1 Tax=Nocardia panacis TaxID=2340916 RepID=A0A3A4JX30_9NOCA|nr:DUF1870 family protein [Nocardia panacis]RJO71411.1 DUF1870 family protein [Nocardia panacis]